VLSVFDLFTIGIGPSSSHTVGPMRAGRRFALGLEQEGLLEATASVKVELFGSLGLTGRGHGSDRAVVGGLEGHTPEEVDPALLPARMQNIREHGRLRLLGRHEIAFDPRQDMFLHRRRHLPGHPNGMRIVALDSNQQELRSRIYYSVGGGFVLGQSEIGRAMPVPERVEVPFPFASGAELLALTGRTGRHISDLVLENEKSRRDEDDVRARLMKIWRAMQDCVESGLRNEGVLPGGLKVTRRAAAFHRSLTETPQVDDPLRGMEWVNLWALAVNEENANGGRVVTAPTNGAAGIIPAVLHYYARFVDGADDDGVARFLLTAGAIGFLYKEMASISGAEVGCQGEVGSAASMAAGALAEVMGGTPAQVENAAEIAMEHNLGLTCDPIGGLVQVPCIERNAIAAVGAINAARMSLHSHGPHVVSLDKVIKTMRDTGRDMNDKYKETSRGGLAVNVVEC
jgi:L-serine dehydratase